MIDFQSAIELVKSHGNEIQCTRLEFLLGEIKDTSVVKQFLEELQLPEGGFPYRKEKSNPYCLSVTSGLLKWINELKLTDTPVAQATITFLKSIQDPKGFWDENPALIPLDPPFWDQPGDLNTQLWITGSIAAQIIRLEHRISSEVVRAGDFLLSYRKPDGAFQGFQHTTWLAIAVLAPQLGIDDPVIQTALHALEGFEDWNSANLCWALDSLYWVLIPPTHKVITKLISLLESNQQPDGSWKNDEEPTDRVTQTLESLITFIQYGQI